jgi:hypothetical protein
VLTENENLTSPTEVTFAKFDQIGNLPSRSVLISKKDSKLPDTFIESERSFVWGTAKIVKEHIPPSADSTRFAWLPAQHLYITASNLDELDDILKSLQISDRK